jgi:hypothetical protein
MHLHNKFNRILFALTVGAGALGSAAAEPQGVQAGSSSPAPAVDRPQRGAPPHGGYLNNIYSIDDNTTELALGMTQGGTMCWLQTFDTRPSAEYDVITEVMAAYGYPQLAGLCVPNGTMVTACVWEDPDDDGDPSNAVLLTTSVSTVQHADTQILNSIPVPPVTVRGRFFVGVFLFHFAGQFPASRDLDTLPQGRSFFLATLTGVSSFNPAQLTSPGHSQIFSMDTAGPSIQPSVWRLRAVGTGAASVVHCSPKVNSLGCTPEISASGVPQASAFSGFVVRCTQVRNNKSGLLFYGVTGRLALPFQGGTLCVQFPLKRSPGRSSGGAAPPANDCTGVYEIDMTAFAKGFYGGSPLPALNQAGTTVNCQWWGRDSGFSFPNNTTLSAGVEYLITP